MTSQVNGLCSYMWMI